MVCLNVLLTVSREADIDTVAGLLTECGRLSRQEPGCVRYEVCHSQTDRRTFMLCERWESPAALDQHRLGKGYLEIYRPRVIPLVERVPHPSDLLE